MFFQFFIHFAEVLARTFKQIKTNILQKVGVSHCKRTFHSTIKIIIFEHYWTLLNITGIHQSGIALFILKFFNSISYHKILIVICFYVLCC